MRRLSMSNSLLMALTNRGACFITQRVSSRIAGGWGVGTIHSMALYVVLKFTCPTSKLMIPFICIMKYIYRIYDNINLCFQCFALDSPIGMPSDASGGHET
jgi:hypothetical protein